MAALSNIIALKKGTGLLARKIKKSVYWLARKYVFQGRLIRG